MSGGWSNTRCAVLQRVLYHLLLEQSPNYKTPLLTVLGYFEYPQEKIDSLFFLFMDFAEEKLNLAANEKVVHLLDENITL